jgi:hypothetical protein
MIKKISKFLLIILFVAILIILYLSFIGVKTEKFNERINSRIIKINKKINLDLKEVKFLLNPYNFTINVTTKEPKILLEGNQILIKDIRTKISLRSLIINKFSINDLEIRTQEIKLSTLIMLGRSFKNSTELFLLDRFIKDGFLTANIKLNFDANGKIKDNYQINGSVKNSEFELLKKFNAKNLNFDYEISKNKYTLKKISVKFNDIKLSFPLIEANEKNNLFLVSGKVETNEKDFDINQLDLLFDGLVKKLDIEKINLSSVNEFSFNINKKFKFNDVNIDSKINIKKLVIKKNLLGIKLYLPNYDETMVFENHKVVVNFKKNKFTIKGNGKVTIASKTDSINYKVKKNNDQFRFDVKINFKNNKLLIDSLDYEKKEESDSLISIKGLFKKNNQIKFDFISLEEKDNKFLLKNLNLDKEFKVISIDALDLDYKNNRNFRNKLFLKRDNSNYNINGNNFDVSKMINNAMNNDEEKSSIFNNLNSKINLKVNKTYIDEVNFINDLSGSVTFKNNKIYDLNLESIFPNNKKINLSITTNDKQEKITKLFTGFPKPLIKRYNFIKGFDEGYLNYYSVKKNEISNSLLIIDNFKVKEVPVFAKILSLASLQGIADLLTGEGIRFTDFEMRFSNKKGLTTIEEMYAIGPAVSILMEGYIQSKKVVSLKGTLVPATTINRSIASIPILGNILVGKKTGEGVFGVSFKIKGTPKDIKTTVNPIKTLTPRFITRTLEKIKKN